MAAWGRYKDDVMVVLKVLARAGVHVPYRAAASPVSSEGSRFSPPFPDKMVTYRSKCSVM